MDNRTIIQQSLDYIEDTLQTEITAAELADLRIIIRHKNTLFPVFHSNLPM